VGLGVSERLRERKVGGGREMTEKEKTIAIVQMLMREGGGLGVQGDLKRELPIVTADVVDH